MLAPSSARSAIGSPRLWRNTSGAKSAMGRTRTQRELAVALQYLSDRLASQKVARAYDLLVPMAGAPPQIKQPQQRHEQISRDLRTSVLGSAEGGQNHRQPDQQPAGICSDSRIHGAGGLDL